MCGIVGIHGSEHAGHDLYAALSVLQHRGQDSAGIYTSQEQKLYSHKSNGLVKDVFATMAPKLFYGDVGVGHLRYSTVADWNASLAQPFYVNSPYGLCLVHNGNLVNTRELTTQISRNGYRHLLTGSDSELLLNVLADELSATKHAYQGADQFLQAAQQAHKRCVGSYSVIVMVVGQGLLGFRDVYGIRPLIIGQRQRADKPTPDYMFASESAALDMLGFEVIRDVNPGESVFIDNDGQMHTKQYENAILSPCIFEYVYLARPDSELDKIPVYHARLRMGEYLAQKILRQRGQEHGLDVVIPVPETSRVSGQTLAQVLNIPFREGLIRNRYVGRTFIMPDQSSRRSSVRQKLNTIGTEIRGKNVLLVDDSIVRGTTAKEIIQMVRDAGAKKVILASAAPPILHQNVYGINIPTTNELVACGRNETEICKLLNADSLIYQDLKDLIASVKHNYNHIKQFECSIFDGKYVTGNVSADYLDYIAQARYTTELN